MQATFTKVFETFASEMDEGELVMNYFDILRSICNFSYSTKKTGELYELSQKLMQNSKIMELFDLDRNNSFNVYEVIHIFLLIKLLLR